MKILTMLQNISRDPLHSEYLEIINRSESGHQGNKPSTLKWHKAAAAIVAAAVAVVAATAATTRKGEQTTPQTCTEMVTDPPHGENAWENKVFSKKKNNAAPTESASSKFYSSFLPQK